MEFIKARGRATSQLSPILILPALSIGNVGQLASELLISSLNVVKAGYLDDPCVLPCVGNDPIGPEADGQLTVAVEVFEDSARGLTIVQQRTPVVKGMMMNFAKNMASWAERSGVKEVIILSGLDAAKRDRLDIVGPQIYYISSVSPDGSDEHCEQLGWRCLQQVSPMDQTWQVLQAEASEDEDTCFATIPLTDETYFAGLPFSLLFACCKARGLKVVCLLSFCSEGDNIPDAFVITEGVKQFLHLQGEGSITWRIPLSWNTVFGPPPDNSLF